MKFWCCVILAMGSLASCTYDYDIQGELPFESKVVVNSLISPDKPIDIAVSWSTPNVSSDTIKVKHFSIKLYEDGAQILDSVGRKGRCSTNIYPKIGSKYFIKILVDGYENLTAETEIPIKSYKIIASLADEVNSNFTSFTIKKQDIEAISRAMWIWVFSGKELLLSNKNIYDITIHS